ncbi:aldo/keto reductase [Thalassospira sp. MA62]|nr:aldo/keto reductase [Thalassospira sp. MA62]
MEQNLFDIPRVGMGCWAIGGAFWFEDIHVGYSGANNLESIRTIHASFDAGIRLFDTSAVYGAGQSETLLGEALEHQPEAIIVTKLGHSFDFATGMMTGPRYDRQYVNDSVEQSLRRLRRDCLDVVLLHLGDLSPQKAQQVFDTLDDLVSFGKIRSYGWSTDTPESFNSASDRQHFSTVEYAMNVFADAPEMLHAATPKNILQLIRSPLAMGVLTGKYSDGLLVPKNDIRSAPADWQAYFSNRQARTELVSRLSTIRELLTTGGRTLAQGAICWLLAKGQSVTPIPGAKNVEQAIENAAAMSFGPLPENIMQEIELILGRRSNDAPKGHEDNQAP